MSHIIRPNIVAYINYVNPLKNAQEARYLMKQFGSLGKLAWWHDYTSPAAESQYGSRSLAVYTLDGTRSLEHLENETKRLTDDLSSICGLPKLEDYNALQHGTIKFIKPNFTVKDILPYSRNEAVYQRHQMPTYVPDFRDVEVKSATRTEPFFVANIHEREGYMSRFVQMRTSDSIPLAVYVDTVY